MPYPGIHYMLNDIGVTSPDEEIWSSILLGDALSGEEKRSPYRQLIWRRTVDPGCAFDWFQFDNAVLTRLVTRPPYETRQYEIYTDAICRSVVARHQRGVLTNITATFWVNVG